MAFSDQPPIPATMVERHIWRVIYRDGSEFHEYPAPDEHHSFNDVEKDRVGHLIVAPNHWLNAEGPTFVVEIADEHECLPVMFRSVRLNVENGGSERWHVFGTQQTVHGVNIKTLTYVSNEGNPNAVAILHRPMDLG